MVEERLGDVIGEAREDEQRRLLQVWRLGGRGGAEEKGQQLGPGVLREEERGELGYGVADLLGDGLGGVGLERGEEVGLERGLAVGGEEGPERGRRGGGGVGGGGRGEELAEEDDGHGAKLDGDGRHGE